MSNKDDIVDRLDRIIKLLVLGMTKDEPQIKRIQLLRAVGYGPTEIAALLGTTANTVNVALHALRKRRHEAGAPQSSRMRSGS